MIKLKPSLAHVLSLDASHKDLWLGRLALTESLDAYMANLADKPHGALIKLGAKFENGKRISPSHSSTPDVVNKYVPSGQKPQPMPRNNGNRRCFICSSPHHLVNTCPQHANQGIMGKGNMG